MKKILRGIAFGAVLSAAVTTSNGVFAQQQKIVDEFKIWKVTFTEKVNIDTVEENAYIIDSKGNKTFLEGGIDETGETVFLMPPQGGYIPEETYTLNIGKGIKSQSGGKLLNGKSIEFKVKGDKIKENYDPITVNMVQYDYKGDILSASSGYMVEEYVITKMDLLKETTKIEIAYSNGKSEVVRDIVNWDKKNGLFTIKSGNEGFVVAQRNNSSQMNWLQNKLNISDTGVVYYALIEKEKYSIAQLKEKLFKDSSLSDAQSKVREYYSSENISTGNIECEKIFLTKSDDTKKIKVYISYDIASSNKILQAFDNNLKDKEIIKDWTARIGNYIKGRFPDYLVESNIMTVLESDSIIKYFSPSEVYFDISTQLYYPKTPIIKHVNVDFKDYFIEK